MLAASGVDAEIDLDAIPTLDGAIESAAAGYVSSLHPQNLRAEDSIDNPAPGRGVYPLLFDPQTAGGLLAAIPEWRLDATLRELEASGCEPAVIGRIRQPEGENGRVRISG
jgi:selenide,water dikinase